MKEDNKQDSLQVLNHILEQANNNRQTVNVFVINGDLTNSPLTVGSTITNPTPKQPESKFSFGDFWDKIKNYLPLLSLLFSFSQVY